MLSSAECAICAGWATHLPMIRAALRHYGNTHAPNDVLAMIADGSAQWWHEDEAFLVTEVVEWPRKKMLRLSLGGGTLDGVRRLVGVAQIWAEAIGCDGMEIVGRPGWERALSGFHRKAVVLVREFV